MEDEEDLFDGEFGETDVPILEPYLDTSLPWATSVIHARQILPTGMHTYSTNETDWNDTRSIVQFEIPFIQRQFNFVYFEITLTSVHNKYKPICGIGLSPIGYRDAMTGWFDQSFGYHSDDGHIFDNSGISSYINFIAKYTKNDTVGLYWDLLNGKIITTMNGQVQYATNDYRRDFSKTKLYPCVTTARNISFSVNFGDDPHNPFRYPLVRKFYSQFWFRNNVQRLEEAKIYTDINIIII